MEVKRLDTEKNLPISVIMADLNGLKMINDAFGHQLGDQLLQKVAGSIKSACRPQDVLARWGGDEFVVLLPNTTYKETEKVVEKIRELCCRENIEMVHVSMSLGWDTKTSSDVSFSEILKNAEDDLYKNKIIQNQGLRGDLINTIIKTLYEKNPREERHSERVGEVAQKIGEAIGFSEIEVGKLKLIGHLHDIGKIAIEDGILNKPGKLTEREQEEVRRHPEVGYRILPPRAKCRIWPIASLPTMNAGTARVTREGYQGKRSRSKPGSSPWRTAMTPCPASGLTEKH
jgi:diguanylate cyclase (GGDEF)-like protein